MDCARTRHEARPEKQIVLNNPVIKKRRWYERKKKERMNVQKRKKERMQKEEKRKK